jgi:hypothetical protein
VATQPTAMPAVTVVDPRLKPRPTVMIVTIVLTVVCLVQQCWPVLVCMVPALIAAVVVSFLVHLFGHALLCCTSVIMVVLYTNNIIIVTLRHIVVLWIE